MPSLTMFTEMEERGLQVSTEKLKEVGKDLMDSNINREDELYVFKEIDNTDNLSSNNDLIDILYNRKEGFGFYPPDRTAKGSPSVSAPTLKLLLSQIEEELETRG
jgi:DNA polymerase I-like protein with 3'-5' exonuclease and polymerase domains